MFLIKIYNNYFSDMTDIINYTFFKKISYCNKTCFNLKQQKNQDTHVHKYIYKYVGKYVTDSMI